MIPRNMNRKLSDMYTSSINLIDCISRFHPGGGMSEQMALMAVVFAKQLA